MLRGRNVIIVSLAAVSAGAHARPDLNAFLNKSAKTTNALIAQVKSDPAVADRYARHYAMPKRDVVVFLSTLRPSTTDKDSVFTIYSVPEDGRLKAHTEVVRRGTPVFSDLRGVPTLIMKCGNPLTRGPRQPEMPNENVVSLVEEEKIDLRDTTGDVIETIPDLDVLETISEPRFSDLPEEPIVTNPGTTTPTQGRPNTISPTGGGFSFAPFGVGLTILGGALGNKGGGSVVPEPGTFLALGAGIALVALRKRRR